MKLFYGILIGLLILSSCSNDDGNEIAGLADFSGNFRLSYISNSLEEICTNSSSNNDATNSPNDFEITSNGRFKQKVYSLNSNNECVVSEILEGKITITGSFYERPNGSVEYDNLEKTSWISFSLANDGKHDSFIIEENQDNRFVTYSYGRSD
ncbi:hypothetical protein FDT66_04950 [Polaribacter aestuariivivens]|uniref:Lipocalin-like domain-containing protein n=1 Tax=Polaribacter aestuariivivens TaxID=2304626 RepID=A0A5S3N854_9FLAO|nr:hypothetical protein [Polaribacter aestuariivivens]TMM31317.1 hypothetical protein FDT66_04950 [Polaribacter aestuariivivens]